jgi:hypothetical protein
MRRFLFLIALCLTCCSIALAHSGGTDSRGGHYDRSTGEYHYHHGKPAHQHPGGVCPYAASPTNTPRPSRTAAPTSAKGGFTAEDFFLHSPFGALSAVGLGYVGRKLYLHYFG